MQLSELSVLDTFFLSALIEAAVQTNSAILDATLSKTLGADWKESTSTIVADFRGDVTNQIKEGSEASEAVATLNGFLGKTALTRRHLENIARAEDDPAKRQALLRAAGWGLGTPRSVKDLKDLAVTMSALIAAKVDEFKRLGAVPEALTFATNLTQKLEDASKSAMKELADVKVARNEVKESYGMVITRIRKIDQATQAVRDGAALVEDKELLKKADALLALFDEALAQAKVQARQKQADEQLPPDLTTPVPEDPEGGNNDGN